MGNTVLTGRRMAIMLLLYAKGASGRTNEVVEGRTRLTKLLFLLDKEHDVFQRASGLKFESYAFGPYDPKIYDDLAFLENMAWLRGSTASTAPTLSFSDVMEESGKDSSVAFLDASELGEADLSFEYLMSGVAEDFPERYETRKYALSDKGLQSIEGAIAAMRGNKDFPKLMSAIEEVKARYNHLPLRDLLRSVYKKYPDSASDSTILDQLRVS
jgi:uncharacterized protein YwgA